MNDRFIKILEFTLKWEGAYSEDPDDPGGATNYGITQDTYQKWRKKNKLIALPVKTITRFEIETIYWDEYWIVGKCERMDYPLGEVHFDTCVNVGPGQAARFLQRAIGVRADGCLGFKTFAILDDRKHSKRAFAIAMIQERRRFYQNIAGNKPILQKFLNGWLNRCDALGKWVA